MSIRLLRVTSWIGQAIAYATVAVSGLVAMASLCIQSSCGPLMVGVEVAATQPMTVDLVVPAEPIAVTVLHGEIDSPLARYRWAALAAIGAVVLLVPVIIIAWRAEPPQRGKR